MRLQLLAPLLVRLPLLPEDQALRLQLLDVCLALGELALHLPLLVLQLLYQSLVRIQETLHIGVLLELLLEVQVDLLVIADEVLELRLRLVEGLAQGLDVLLGCLESHLEVPDLLLLGGVARGAQGSL